VSLMETVNDVLKKYDPFIKLVVSLVANKLKLKDHAVDTRDDLLAYGRIAAWKAIETHRTDREAELKTYINACISNRLLDLKRTHSRKKRSATVVNELPEVSYTDIGFSTFEFSHDAEKIMTDKERLIMEKISDNAKISEIASDRRIFRKGTTKQEVISCLQRIRHKLMLKDLSPQT
jgi:DNA-directed RNA polymerase specialized sigma24 family protein